MKHLLQISFQKVGVKLLQLGLIAMAAWLSVSCGDAMQSSQSPILSSYLVQTQDRAALDVIAREYEITKNNRDGSYEVVLPKDQVDKLLKLDPNAIEMETDIRDVFKRLKEKDPNYFAGYHDYPAVEQFLKDAVSKYPALASFSVYGKTKQGRPLYVLKISDNVTTDESEPELMITAATHGNEIAGTETILTFVTELLEGYGRDARLTKMVNDHEIYFIPVVNADGFVSGERWDNDVDPNRIYPYPNNPNLKPINSIEPLVAFFHTKNFVGSMDLHTYSQLIMYPWAYTTKNIPAADEKIFKNLCSSMAEINKYETGQVSQVLYVAQGSSADYYYWKNHTMALAVELTTTHTPSSEQLPSIFDEAREMAWRFIEHF